MKLIRFGERGREKPGILLDGCRKDLSEHFQDWNHDFFQNAGLATLEEIIDLHGMMLPDVPEGARWGACIARPGKIVAIGLNYQGHIDETGAEPPTEPVIFSKATSAVCGAYDDLIIPRGSEQSDWEVELAVIVQRDVRYLDSAESACEYIAGYCVADDVSERSFQHHRGGQWTKGKSADTFCPLGPFLATVDEVPDVGALEMVTEVNGERMQESSPSDMVFTPCHLIHYLSQFMTLEAGDVICTGTPPGVGMARKPPRFLKVGDRVRVAIDGLGEQLQTCVAAD